MAKLCENTPKCSHCASESHKYDECTLKTDLSKALCVNCNKNHPSNSRKRAVYLKKKSNMETNRKNNYE